MDKIADNPTVSVAMATYNGAKHIREQLDSLAAQTLLPMELVVTDDGSTDRTIEFLEEFSRTAPFPVRIYRNSDRLGHADNFLKAANLCKGDLIAFSDQDDVWMPEKIEICAGVFSTQDVVLTVHASRKWYGGDRFGGTLHSYPPKKSLAPISVDPVGGLPGFSMMIRKSLLEITDAKSRPGSIFCLGDPKIQMSHDEWAWFLASLFGTIVLLPDVLAWYRRHETNTAGPDRKAGLIRVLFRSLAVSDYMNSLALLRKCLDVVKNIDNGLTLSQQSYLPAAVAYFERRIKYCERRQLIYSPNSSLKKRVSALTSMLISGGYLKTKIGITPGPRAALKDAFVGVTGISRTVIRINP